jgi:hypothetical protein
MSPELALDERLEAPEHARTRQSNRAIDLRWICPVNQEAPK